MKVKINGKTFTAQVRELSSNASMWWNIFNEETNEYVNTPVGILALWPSKKYTFSPYYSQYQDLAGYVTVEFLEESKIDEYKKVTILTETYVLGTIDLATDHRDIESGIVCKWNVYTNDAQRIGIITRFSDGTYYLYSLLTNEGSKLQYPYIDFLI
jgi:hypothetical protein